MRISADTQLQRSAHVSEIVGQPRWIACVGLADLAFLDAFSTGTVPLLLVLSTDAQAQQLLGELGLTAWPQHWRVQVQLVGAQSGECTWFYYNDSRYDGIVPLENLQRDYPNLRLEGIELRPQIDLDALLNSWDLATNDGGVLLLGPACDDLLATLSIELAMLLRAVVWKKGGTVSSESSFRLREACLLPCQDVNSPDLLVWCRDSFLHQERTLVAERDSLQLRVQDLEQRLAAINSELSSLLDLLNN